jgi:hypothetical protein
MNQPDAFDCDISSYPIAIEDSRPVWDANAQQFVNNVPQSGLVRGDARDLIQWHVR